MSKAMAVVLADLSAEQARRAVLSLLAMGIDGRASPMAGPLAGPSWQVSVPEEDVAGAIPVLEDALADAEEAAEAAPAPQRHSSADAPRIWTLANSGSAIAIALVCVSVHLAVHGGSGPSPRSTMIEAGAVAPWLVAEGQWWRLASAAFLHFDVRHLLGNMASLFFLGPPLADSIGHARTLVLFGGSAVVGNLASQILGSEGAIKAGASGGICGLLGALAGVALARMATVRDPGRRRPAWQSLGALAALFAMIVGFEPGRDHYAHVGGLLAGLVMGRSLHQERPLEQA